MKFAKPCQGNEITSEVEHQQTFRFCVFCDEHVLPHFFPHSLAHTPLSFPLVSLVNFLALVLYGFISA